MKETLEYNGLNNINANRFEKALDEEQNSWIKTVDEAKSEIERYYLMGRSKKRKKATRTYANELFESLLSMRGISLSEGKTLLNMTSEEELLGGCEDWKEYSYSGRSLTSHEDICNRLCTDFVIRKKQNGKLQYSKTETWLDLQANFLEHASKIVLYAVNCHPSRKKRENREKEVLV